MNRHGSGKCAGPLILINDPKRNPLFLKRNGQRQAGGPAPTMSTWGFIPFPSFRFKVNHTIFHADFYFLYNKQQVVHFHYNFWISSATMIKTAESVGYGTLPDAVSSKKGRRSPMRKNQTDLRVLRTRKTIKEAFVELMEEKGFDAITVKDITTRPGSTGEPFMRTIRTSLISWTNIRKRS